VVWRHGYMERWRVEGEKVVEEFSEARFEIESEARH
jgi:hypothetical protein